MQGNSNAGHENNIHDHDPHRAHMHSIRYSEDRRIEVVSYCLGYHPDHLGKRMSAARVAKLTGINQATVSKWVKKYSDHVPDYIKRRNLLPHKNEHKGVEVSHDFRLHSDGTSKHEKTLRETIDRLTHEIDQLTQQINVMEKVIVNYAIKFNKKEEH